MLPAVAHCLAFCLLSGAAVLDPHPVDLVRFPDREAASEYRGWIWSAQRDVSRRQELDLVHADLWRGEQSALCRADYAWDCLVWAHANDVPVWRSYWLRKLRDAIGPQNYYAGRLPAIPTGTYERK
jgi:hypothetical protein